MRTYQNDTSRFDNAGIVNGRKMFHVLRHSAIASLIRNFAPLLQAQDKAWNRSFDTALVYFHQVGRIDNHDEDIIIYSKAK